MQEPTCSYNQWLIELAVGVLLLWYAWINRFTEIARRMYYFNTIIFIESHRYCALVIFKRNRMFNGIDFAWSKSKKYNSRENSLKTFFFYYLILQTKRPIHIVFFSPLGCAQSHTHPYGYSERDCFFQSKSDLSSRDRSVCLYTTARHCIISLLLSDKITLARAPASLYHYMYACTSFRRSRTRGLFSCCR